MKEKWNTWASVSESDFDFFVKLSTVSCSLSTSCRILRWIKASHHKHENAITKGVRGGIEIRGEEQRRKGTGRTEDGIQPILARQLRVLGQSVVESIDELLLLARILLSLGFGFGFGVTVDVDASVNVGFCLLSIHFRSRVARLRLWQRIGVRNCLRRLRGSRRDAVFRGEVWRGLGIARWWNILIRLVLACRGV